MTTLSSSGCLTGLDRPRLLSWGGRALYVGPSIGVSQHRNTVPVFCIGLAGGFRLEVGAEPARPDGRVATALVPAGTLHRVSFAAGPIACLYLDPMSEDAAALDSGMRTRFAGCGIRHQRERSIIEQLASLFEPVPLNSDPFETIETILGLPVCGRGDARVRSLLRIMDDHPARDHALIDLARAAGLSPSRFRHLFRVETGIPLKRYRVWNRMRAAIGAVPHGRTLTEAAHYAGFSSSAHFSSAFRSIFGIAPRDIVRAQVLVGDPVPSRGFRTDIDGPVARSPDDLTGRAKLSR